MWSALAGDDVFLDEQLDAVGEGLQPAELAADAGRAEAILNAAGDFAFEPDEEDGRQQHEGDKEDGANDAGKEVRGRPAHIVGQKVRHAH